VQPAQLLAERGENVGVRGEHTVDQALDVPDEGGQRGTQFMRDLTEQPRAARQTKPRSTARSDPPRTEWRIVPAERIQRGQELKSLVAPPLAGRGQALD